ncbi:MAG TPA: DNA-directed RNA polymerase subunit D [Methanothermobacter sp.]|nr:DNA-directed RNA polymerase subunit D [Methanothermobacter sp. MT-2]HHW04365.1 DNA-directed RNA polymerase subunit D [Methanothermobacter sp.]HOK72407.1 DNA-directed RNA polymerase subunit D [Methanothermobacter sp.]HOL69190.1 DNA-directed RNA polymerase subunit D [Methanothermobacter sp.]HPQ03894.1 DNA-directed RNA polymerase subunit D [Methanothermobacter sp.]
MDIEIKERSDNEMILIIKDSDTSFVNAIRRTSMTEVPKLAIEYVNIIKNDSSMFDEVVAHRLGLIPLKSDEEAINGIIMPSECECEDYCPKCGISLTLKKKGPGIVHSNDLKSEDEKVVPAYDTIPILRLRDDEEIELEAIAQLGVGMEHAKWKPTTACAYKYYPRITIGEECDQCHECIKACPRGILEEDESGKPKIVNIEDCTMCKSCMRACEKGAINVGYEDGSFIFKVETDGSISAEELLERACNILIEKADNIIIFLEEE